MSMFPVKPVEQILVEVNAEGLATVRKTMLYLGNIICPMSQRPCLIL